MDDLFGHAPGDDEPAARTTKLDCWGCNIAAVNPKSGAYQSDCQECQARSLAGTQAFHDSMRLGYLTHAYQRAIWDVFGTSTPLPEAHAKVKAWSEKIRPLQPNLVRT